MKYAWSLTAALMGTVLIQSVAEAKSADEIHDLAQAMSVKILVQLQGEKAAGSGTIIHRQGNLYTLITNRHVVCKKDLCTQLPKGVSYTLVLADGKNLRVDARAIKLLGKDLDLAIIQFRSSRNYAVAKLAPQNSLKVDDTVYTAGFPFEKQKFEKQEFKIEGGKAIAVVNKRLVEDKGGYTIIYDAETLPGMSGGGVFDENGLLVAVHGVGDLFRKNTELGPRPNIYIGRKIGYNRGIPIRWMVGSLAAQGVKLVDQSFINSMQDFELAATADEYFIAGYNKYLDPGNNVLAGKREAIQSLTQAIRLNPSYVLAYLVRYFVYGQLEDYQLALADMNAIISLTPQDHQAYYMRGFLKWKAIRDLKGALPDFDQAIALAHENGKDSRFIYRGRGLLKMELLDYRGALADFHPSIAYSDNPQQALEDTYNGYNQLNSMVNLPPKDFSNSPFYIRDRGILKYLALNDPSGGIADVRQAIKLASVDAPTVKFFTEMRFFEEAKRDLKLMGASE
jgi:tetratricopeptide (TPR) repeat protein